MKRLLLALAATALFAACDAAAPGEGGETVPPRALSPAEARLVAADNAFSFGLLAHVVAGTPENNVFISPLSASMALGMTLNGARGQTRTDMERALGKTGMAPGEINTGYRGLIALLPHLDPRVTFTVANAIYSRTGFAVEPDFARTNRESFDATVEPLDFGNPTQAAKTMNAWASSHTNGRIGEIMSPDMIGDDLVMVLMNAIYFKATWKYAFREKNTRDEPFTLRDGKSKSVKMMHQTGTFPYYQGDGFRALDLPYGDSLYSLTVLLPDAGQDVDALVATLDAPAWQAVVDGFVPASFEVGLPRLKMLYSGFFNTPLVRMGMGIAFSDAADFSGISRGGGLAISFVKQDAFVEMNEKGTEAAAVTVVGVGTTSAGPRTPPPFVVDRPYVVVLRERTTGAILFAGRILNPAA